MIQRISKRFLSLLLVAVMVLALLPVIILPAFAATSGTVTGLSDTNIGLSFSGTADDAWSATGTTITGSVVSVGGTCSDTHYNSTLTIKNNKATKATLSFNYAIEQNSGTITVDGSAVTTNGSFSKELAAGSSITVKIESGSTTATKIAMTSVALVSDVTATTTFVPAENGNYTVDGKAITEEYSNTQSSMTAYQVVATPADGYQFLGWYNLTTGKCIATAASTALNIENDCTITAKFASKAAALFETGGQRFADLNEAVAYAQANKQSKITLATDGSISGTYTIPAGITLLIPFDAAGTLYTDAPAVIRTAPASKPFRTLTMSDGASITVNGAISLGGRYYAAGGSEQGRPVGDYGYIKMADNSSITVKNGGNLYAWGFISGSGSVLAESGATVYEFYQIADFRGGSASSNMGHGVFPFSQYFVQNIEVPLTLNAGANEQVYSGVYAMKSTYTTAINFIGDTGMFKVESGSFTKDYDEKTDRLVFTVNGEAALNTLSLTLAGMSVDSASYVLPITNNITINIQSGNVTINQDAALLAGVEVNIAEGAGLTVANGKNIYIYDRDEWVAQNFVTGGKFKAVQYAPGKHYNRTEENLIDVKVDVNGTLTAIGGIYTTAGGADICSSAGTGVYNQQGKPGTETKTYQYTQNNSSVTAHEIPITPAKLHNADGSYTKTAASKAGDTYVYANGKWALKGNEITITFDPNGGAGSMEPMSVNPGVGNKLTGNTFTRENYTFTGWNTAADGTGMTYADGATVNFSADTTLYAQWTQNPVITFNANGGEGTMGTQTVKPNEATALTANTFTRADYDFAGWNTAKDGTGTAYDDKANITTNENVTLYAQWTLHKYHVRWLNWDDTVLQDGYYTCEDEAGWDDRNENPSRSEDENYTYVFAMRWTPYDETKGINGWGFKPHEDVDFKAVFNEFKKLTVTFNANGGIGTMDSVKIANGGSGEYYMLPECGFTREGYTFNGWLITGMVKMSVWDDEEELNDELWTEPELLALSDLTLKASWKHSDGWFTDVNGKQYYKDGELQKTGWTVIDGNTYYLDTETGYAATGITTLVPDGATEAARCVFDANGVFQSNVTGVYSVGNDTYWLNSGIIEEEAGLKRVVKENGEVNYYYFAVQKNLGEREGLTLSAAVKSTVLNGKDCWLHKTNGLALPEWGYYFDENGVILHDEDTGKNGILKDGEDLYYYVDGIKAPAGMIKIGDDYYYANSKGKLIVNQTYYCSRMNGLMEEGTYAFDAEGKLIPGATDKNGIVKDDDGVLRYYVNGKVTYVGLIEIDGDFYYVRSSGEVVTNCVYWITWTHGLKEAGYYTFDESGKLTGTPKNGIVEEDGVLHYYVNGTLTYAGLIKIGNDYYYVNSKCEVVHDCDYTITWTHGLLPQGRYHFDVDGKLTGAVAPLKNGIYEEDGSLYFYRNGERTYAGLIQIDGDYYYVRSTCEVVHDRSYYVYWTHGLMPEGYYNFDSAGRMILDSETE